MSWLVRHFDHLGNAFGESFPNDLSFSLYLGRIGSISYNLDLDDPLANITATNPYETDFGLYRNTTRLMGGMHTAINVDDVEGNTLGVSGQDWKHYLDKIRWLFDPTHPLDYVYRVTNRDIALVVKDLIDGVLASLYTLPINTSSITPVGQLINYRIDPADTESIYSKITSLSQIKPGFDFEISPNLQAQVSAPRMGTLQNYVLEQGSNIYKLRYTNTGPEGTVTMGLASVGGTRSGSVVIAPTVSRFRRLEANTEFSDLVDATLLSSYTAGQADRDAAPHIEFSCTLIPETGQDLWQYIGLGNSYPVYANIGWSTIDDVFRLVGIECSPNDQGDEEITLSFDDGSLSL